MKGRRKLGKIRGRRIYSEKKLKDECMREVEKKGLRRGARVSENEMVGSGRGRKEKVIPTRYIAPQSLAFP